MTLLTWRVWCEEAVIELLAYTQTEALILGAELLNISPVNLRAIRIHEW